MLESFSTQRSSVFVRVISLCSLFILAVPFTWAQTHPNAKDLLRQMTLEEKVAQLSQHPGFPIPEFVQQVGNPEDVVRKYGAGSVL